LVVDLEWWWRWRQRREDGGNAGGEAEGIWILEKMGWWKWGGRRWDWGEVGVQCMLPAGMVYFVMAWAGALRREFVMEC